MNHSMKISNVHSGHVVRGPRVLLHRLVVFSKEIVDIHLEPPNKVITNPSYVLLATGYISVEDMAWDHIAL